MGEKRAGRLTAVLAAALIITGCTSGQNPSARTTPTVDREAQCRDVAQSVLDATQRYVDGFSLATAATTAGGKTTPPRPGPTATPMSEADFSKALAGVRDRLVALDCDVAEFRERLAAGMPSLKAEGPIARAVLTQLQVSLTGRLPDHPVSRDVKPGDDLVNVLAEVPEGSTLVFRAGTYRLAETVVLLRGVTIRGAGPDRTTLTSATADAAVLVMTDQRVTLDAVTLRHSGTSAASVVVTGPTADLAVHSARVAGGRSDAKGQGGAGILLSAPATEQLTVTKQATMTAKDSEFIDNQTAGIAVGGTHRADISHSTFARNGQCAVCYLGSSDGTVRDSQFNDNAVGIVASSSARPSVVDNTFTSGEVGVQVSGQAAPIVTGNSISNVRRAAMIYAEEGAGTLDNNTCHGDQVGIFVTTTAYPYVKRNPDCRITLQR
jgi:parallel beta-helix repeat protein